MVEAGVKGAGFLVGREKGPWRFRANKAYPMICSVVFCSAMFLDVVLAAAVLQAEKVLLFSQDTNLTSLLLEAKDLEARVIILSARFVRSLCGFHDVTEVDCQRVESPCQ